MGVNTENCPNCGGRLIFDADTGKLVCDSCGLEINEKDFSDARSYASKAESKSYDSEDASEDGNDEMKEYICKNCGAVLLVDKDVSALNCSFCDSPMVIEENITDKFRPDLVAPFSVSREAAEAAFKKWCKGALFMPDEVKKANRIKEMKGIYVPYWLHDMNCDGEVSFEGTKTRTWSTPDYIYTETSYFDVRRDVSAVYEKIPTDASEKMDDRMMDLIEPFRFDELKSFKAEYMRGFTAEKYNYTGKQLENRAKERVEKYTEAFATEDIHGYATLRPTGRRLHTTEQKQQYALMPVWMICYNWKENLDHNFYMNGQTGKIVGKAPVSVPKVLLFGTLFAIGYAALFLLLSFIIFGGPIDL